MIVDLLKALESQAQAINKRPQGVGHLLHIAPDPDSGAPGFIVRCAGAMAPNPRFDEDTAAGFKPDAEVLIQHAIGVISKGPESDDFIAIENPGDAVFTLDPAQTDFDPTNPVCFCGKGPVI